MRRRRHSTAWRESAWWLMSTMHYAETEIKDYRSENCRSNEMVQWGVDLRSQRREEGCACVEWPFLPRGSRCWG
jgi:hypothetical protein